MKNLTIILIAFLTISLVSCKEDAKSKIKAENLKKAKERNQVNKEDAPVIEFEKTEHDWGDVNEGDNLETTFKFKNTGKSELIITNIKATCGCTVPKNWKREPIMPGEESEFSVNFNTKGKPNKQSKTVTITSNTFKGRETVKVKANVKPDPEQEKIREEKRKKQQEAREKAAKERAKKQAEANKAKATKK